MNERYTPSTLDCAVAQSYDKIYAMSNASIICKPTKDTYIRFGIILLALWGFALYFFFDATTGYPKKNAAYFSYKAFVIQGAQAGDYSASAWRDRHAASPLIVTSIQQDGKSYFIDTAGKQYPLPSRLEASLSKPTEFLDHAKIRESWNQAWVDYSARMHYDIRPPEKPFDQSYINEQWIAAGVCIFLACIILYLIIRTSKRQLSIDGTGIKAAGQEFDVSEIESIDIRQWGAGYKGCSYFKVNGKKLKIDGMTYGGFEAKNGEPAERWMQAVLQAYKQVEHGIVIEYEKENATTGI